MPALAPVYFIGHGSPMNAIEANPFTQALKNMAQLYPEPKAILCVSAHWLTNGTWVTHMKHPKTIHDFYGFPQALFDIQYPAPGNPAIAENISQSIQEPAIHLDDDDWGIDHGTWSVVRHIFPNANIPVVQLSIDLSKPPDYHYKLGQELRRLRSQGVLIIGSGNIVHNLRQIRWEPDAKPYDWALEFDEQMKGYLEKRDVNAISTQFYTSESGKLSVPTFDHYFPLLYVLGAVDAKDDLRVQFEGIQNGSISMRTVVFI